MLHVSQLHRGNGRSRRGERRGIVLLVVIAMLTLFSVVALSFVFYAEGEAQAAALAGPNSNADPDIDPEALMSYFMSQLVYGTTNYSSVLRGHSLAETKFGQAGNAPYSGIGRLHYKNTSLGGDDYYYPNYQYFPADGFIRDPEFYGVRNPSTQPTPNLAAYRAGNAPYTYPDLNNMFLARVDIDPSTGLPVVVAPSFHRLYLPNTNSKYGTLYPNTTYNPNFWAFLNGNGLADANTLAMIRNIDNSAGFKYVAPNGTVTYSNNDSYWLDIGYPVVVAPNGKKYKPLFAPLVMDLDNRLSMLLAGNSLGGVDTNGNPVSLSNRGYGPTEINLKYLYDLQGLSSKDLLSIFAQRGSPTGGGAYPPTWPANAPNTVGSTRDGPAYARIDFNGVNTGGYQMPALGSFVNTPTFATWYSGDPVTNPPELKAHPLGFNAFSSYFLPPIGEFDGILRYGSLAAASNSSQYYKNWPKTFSNAYLRSQLTPCTWQLDSTTGSPYAATGPLGGYQYIANSNYAVGPGFASPNLDPNAKPPYTPMGEFRPGSYASLLAGLVRINLNRISTNLRAPRPVPYYYDYPLPDSNGYMNLAAGNNAAIFQSAQAVRQQLARDIYNIFVGKFINVVGGWDPNTYANAAANVAANANVIPVNSTAGFPPAGKLNLAMGGGVLVPVTYNGVTPTSFLNCSGVSQAVPAGTIITNALMTPGSAQWQAARWLAQLSVNIVDYIDSDDISTPFLWYTDPNFGATPAPGAGQYNLPEYVFGTEAPRLALNEAYAQYDNDPADPGLKLATPSATKYRLNVWTELHNPSRFTQAVTATGAPVTIAATSNGVALPPPTGTIDVTSATGLPLSGALTINLGTGYTVVTYTGVTGNTLTGCSGGSGTLATGQAVSAEPFPLDAGMARLNVGVGSFVTSGGGNPLQLTVDPMQTGTSLPQGTIYVTDPGKLIAQYPTAGMIALNFGNGQWTTVSYTGTQSGLGAGMNVSAFTGCNGGVGTLVPGPAVAPAVATVVIPYNAAYQLVLETPDGGLATSGNNAGDPGVVTTIDVGSTGQALPPASGTINVVSVANLPASGKVGININGTVTYVSYTGTQANPPALTGVTGGIGTLWTGQAVSIPTWNQPSVWGNGNQPLLVQPANGAFSDATRTNRGFFVVNPNNTGGYIAGRDPFAAATFSYASDQMTVPSTSSAVPGGGGSTVLLRRLANPYLLPQPNPTITNPPYNPYITVDAMTSLPTWDNRDYAPMKVNNAPATATFAAYGRLQPYAAAYMAKQPNAAVGVPSNTFFQHNAATSAGGPTLTSPFDWLTHLDRPLVNVLELLHVSRLPPHLLTQNFVTYINGTPSLKFQHYAPWTNNGSAIYRALEYMGVPSYLNGASTLDNNGYPVPGYNGALVASPNQLLVPGRININTLNEPITNNYPNFSLAVTDPNTKVQVPPIFMALADPRPGVSNFTQAEASNAYLAFVASRTQGPLLTPSINDVPVRSFAAGPVNSGDTQYPNGAGLGDTLLRLDKFGNPLLQLPLTGARQHPYQRYELLQKLFNNVTTTSETFAVWLTVGFFEVDDSVTPPTLGQEINYTQGRQIRHRMFAIVDRSQMMLYLGPQPNYSIRNPNSPPNNNRIVPYWTISQ